MQEKSYERFQTEMAHEFAHLGLLRGKFTAAKRREEAIAKGTVAKPLNDHKTTAQYRAEQAEITQDLQAKRTELEQQSRELSQATEAAKKSEAAARKREQAAEEREKKAAALERGIEALCAEELEFKPATSEKREGLIWGRNAKPEKDWRDRLVEAVKPAYKRVLSVAQRLHQIKDRLLKEREDKIREDEQRIAKRDEESQQDAFEAASLLQLGGSKAEEFKAVALSVRLRRQNDRNGRGGHER
jgi:hypothetical protein